MDYYGGVNGGKIANAIRGVSRYNPLGRYYHESSNNRFGQLSKYTGFQN